MAAACFTRVTLDAFGVTGMGLLVITRPRKADSIYLVPLLLPRVELSSRGQETRSLHKQRRSYSIYININRYLLTGRTSRA